MDVALLCYKWTDGWDRSLGGVRYRAFSSANNGNVDVFQTGGRRAGDQLRRGFPDSHLGEQLFSLSPSELIDFNAFSRRNIPKRLIISTQKKL